MSGIAQGSASEITSAGSFSSTCSSSPSSSPGVGPNTNYFPSSVYPAPEQHPDSYLSGATSHISLAELSPQRLTSRSKPHSDTTFTLCGVRLPRRRGRCMNIGAPAPSSPRSNRDNVHQAAPKATRSRPPSSAFPSRICSAGRSPPPAKPARSTSMSRAPWRAGFWPKP